MKTNLVKQPRQQLEESRTGSLPAARTEASGFFSFTYSHREVSLSGRKTRIRSREYRFQNGKLESEEFDGTLDASAYRNAVAAVHELAMAQTRSFLQFFSAFLPFNRR
jgi:hypothetical protein